MTTHFSILAWKIPWTEEPGGLHSKGSQRVRCDWATNATTTIQIFRQRKQVTRERLSQASFRLVRTIPQCPLSENNEPMFAEFWVKIWSRNFKHAAYVIRTEEVKSRHSQICKNLRQMASMKFYRKNYAVMKSSLLVVLRGCKYNVKFISIPSLE